MAEPIQRAPRVSVVLPAYNAEPYVGASVASILAQTWTDLELIVVDDGSTDGTRETLLALADPRVRVIRHEKNQGLVAGLNEALREARGAYIVRQDADDVALATRVEHQVRVLDSEPDVAAVGCAMAVCSEAGEHFDTWTFPATTTLTRWRAFLRTPVPHAAVAFRRDAAIAVGGYRQEFLHAEDYDLWARFLEHGQEMRSLPEVLERYRWTAGGASRRYAHAQREAHVAIAARLIRALLAREVDAGHIALLAHGLDGAATTPTSDEVEGAIDLLLELARAFKARPGLRRTDAATIDRDVEDHAHALLSSWRAKGGRPGRMLQRLGFSTAARVRLTAREWAQGWARAIGRSR